MNLTEASETPRHTSSRVDWWILALCWLQALATVVAAALAHWEVESIVATCPTMAVLGWLLTRLALRKDSRGLVLFGLFSPLVTSLIALLIAIFQWNPPDAAQPVAVLLTIHSVITTLWCGRVVLRFRRIGNLVSSGRRVEFQFSLMRLLVVMTVICILAALLRSMERTGDWVLFASYGILALAVSVALWAWFDYRVRRFCREKAAAVELE